MLADRVPYRLVDAFTDKPFEGNPAAVVLFQDERIDDEQLLQNLALEYNLQETAFLRRLDGARGRESPLYRLRWFTPVQEFPLCGHATLASAHYLLDEVHPDADRISFETVSGLLHTTRSASGAGLELDFPADDSVLHSPSVATVQSVRARLAGVNESLAAAVVDVRVGKLAVIVELDAAYDLATAGLDASPLVRVCTSLRPSLPQHCSDATHPISQASSERYFVFTQVALASSDCNIYSRVLDGAEACPEDPVVCTLRDDFPVSLVPADLGLASVRPDWLGSLHVGAVLPRQRRCRESAAEDSSFEPVSDGSDSAMPTRRSEAWIARGRVAEGRRSSDTAWSGSDGDGGLPSAVSA